LKGDIQATVFDENVKSRQIVLDKRALRLIIDR